MARSPHAAGGAGSVTQQAFDDLLGVLSEAAGQAGVAGPATTVLDTAEPPAVVATPLSLVRVGRSRRLGALLDLELAVAVEVSGSDALSLTEQLLLAIELSPHSRIEPLPAGRAGLGFVVVQPVSVAITEPTGPPVREPVVEVHPLDVSGRATGRRLAWPTHEGS